MRLLLALLLLAGPASGAMAQGATSGMPQQSRMGEAGQGGEFGRPRAQIAPVGAGTTSASTTGSSGPKKQSGKPGEIHVPPLPNPSQCEPYKDAPAYAWCLRVVLRQP